MSMNGSGSRYLHSPCVLAYALQSRNPTVSRHLGYETVLLSKWSDGNVVRQTATRVSDGPTCKNRTMAKGPVSQDLSALISLLLERSVEPDAEPVHVQHLVSKSLLKAFTKKDDHGTGIVHTLVFDRPQVRHSSTSGTRYQHDFVSFRSRSAEERWQEIETLLPAAIQAAVDGSLFADPAKVEVLKRAVVLHFFARRRCWISTAKRLMSSGIRPVNNSSTTRRSAPALRSCGARRGSPSGCQPPYNFILSKP